MVASRVPQVMPHPALVLLVLIPQRVLDARLDTAVQVASVAPWARLAAQYVRKAPILQLAMGTYALRAVPVTALQALVLLGLMQLLAGYVQQVMEVLGIRSKYQSIP